MVTFPADSWKSQVEEKTRFQELLENTRSLFGEEIDIELSVKTVILEPVEKAIADGVFCSRILKDRDQSSFLGISLAVCFFGRVSPL